jgi:hypothetical protein
MNQEQKQNLYVDFQKAQHRLLHAWSANLARMKSRLSLTTILFRLWKNSRTSNQKHGTLSSSSFLASQDEH